MSHRPQDSKVVRATRIMADLGAALARLHASAMLACGLAPAAAIFAPLEFSQWVKRPPIGCVGAIGGIGTPFR
jgi:hypothetical protein